MWKIAMKPGKLPVYGRVHGAAFIGLPGNRCQRDLPGSWCGFLLAAGRKRGRSGVPMQLRVELRLVTARRQREFLRAHERAGRWNSSSTVGSAALESTIEPTAGRNDILAGTVIACGETGALLPSATCRTRRERWGRADADNQRNETDMTNKVKILYLRAARRWELTTGELDSCTASVSTVGPCACQRTVVRLARAGGQRRAQRARGARQENGRRRCVALDGGDEGRLYPPVTEADDGGSERRTPPRSASSTRTSTSVARSRLGEDGATSAR